MFLYVQQDVYGNHVQVLKIEKKKKIFYKSGKKLFCSQEWVNNRYSTRD